MIKEIYEKNKKDRKRNRMVEELWNSCLILKNLATFQQGRSLSTDYIIERLLKNSKNLRATYSDLLLEYRKGNEKLGFENFANEIGTKEGRVFAGILEKLDYLEPKEMVEIIGSYQDGLIEKRVTLAMKKTERNILIATIFSTITMFILLLNFTVVVVFTDTMKMLENLL